MPSLYNNIHYGVQRCKPITIGLGKNFWITWEWPVMKSLTRGIGERTQLWLDTWVNGKMFLLELFYSRCEEWRWWVGLALDNLSFILYTQKCEKHTWIPWRFYTTRYEYSFVRLTFPPQAGVYISYAPSLLYKFAQHSFNDFELKLWVNLVTWPVQWWWASLGCLWDMVIYFYVFSLLIEHIIGCSMHSCYESHISSIAFDYRKLNSWKVLKPFVLALLGH